MSTSRLLCSLVLGTLLISQISIHAQEMGSHKWDMEKSLSKLQTTLDLSTQQVEQIKHINQKYKAKYDQEKQSMKESRQSVMALSDAANPDYAKIESILVTQSQKMIPLMIDKIKHKKEIESLLSPEQVTKMKSLKQRMLSKWKHKRDQ